MNTSFERSSERTDEWYTPKWIIEDLQKAGIHFDLDPCAPIKRPFELADKYYTKEENGLTQPWNGCVWCNPPYSRKLLDAFIEKMSQHNNGVALVFNRMDTALWHKVIFPTASAILIMQGRIKFLDENGCQKQGAGCGSILIAWGSQNAKYLETCNISGKYINLKEESK